MFLNGKVKRCFFTLCIFVFCGCIMTGCGNKMDKNGSMTAEDGRSYGGTIKGEEGETLSTAFFDMTIEDSSKYETFQFDDGLYQPESGNTYLVVTVVLKNTYEKDLPMSITDFTLNYEGADEQPVTGYGKADLKLDDYMENVFTLKQGESITKKILYTVPDKEEYTLGYLEYYEDKFEGNQFTVALKPKKKLGEEGQEETTGEGQTENQEETTGDGQTENQEETTGDGMTDTKQQASQEDTQIETNQDVQTDTPQEGE